MRTKTFKHDRMTVIHPGMVREHRAQSTLLIGDSGHPFCPSCLRRISTTHTGSNLICDYCHLHTHYEWCADTIAVDNLNCIYICKSCQEDPD